jgi:hypothetical protein
MGADAAAVVGGANARDASEPVVGRREVMGDVRDERDGCTAHTQRARTHVGQGSVVRNCNTTAGNAAAVGFSLRCNGNL